MIDIAFHPTQRDGHGYWTYANDRLLSREVTIEPPYHSFSGLWADCPLWTVTLWHKEMPRLTGYYESYGEACDAAYQLAFKGRAQGATRAYKPLQEYAGPLHGAWAIERDMA